MSPGAARRGGAALLIVALLIVALLAVALLAAGLLAAHDPASPATTAEIEAFLGTALPPGRSDLRAADEQGIDRLMRLRLDAPEAEAEAFAARLVPGGLARGVDPGLVVLGSGLDWWPAALPEGAAGDEALVAGHRAHKVVVAPSGPGRQRVWVAVFTL
ncbi:hypothetical protein VQ02_15580 [Methylobacterium variabile]|uniref:Uncharacterized protein n=1 Tax=Methylobacterium variabile TaxID=298794 RepID=A0A0J6SRQ5_9HYPH|nr:hypothetical protein [Methylobacterium variabile]KMO36379.1 hypothetical protein VQ02_15580 [Methylobacterium variabile]